MKNFLSFLFRRVSPTFVLLAAVLVLPGMLRAADGKTAPQRVAVLPFALNAPAQMEYLVDGIRSMLDSRLAAGGSVLLVEQAEVDKALAEAGPLARQTDYTALARRLGADYLISGSFTAMGSGASLDARVFDGSGGPPQRFFAAAAQEGEVITAVGMLAREIGNRVLGQETAGPAAAKAAPAPASAVPPAQQPAFTTAHPDRMLFNTATPYQAAASPFVRPTGGTSANGFTKSQNLEIGLRAMDVGDVDGDGQPEVVLAGANRVTIYRLAQNRLTPVSGTSTPTTFVVHAVSLADLNQNGRDEIYVSAADNQTPHSFGLEWDGQQFAPLFKDADWYIRAVRLPGEGEVLAGQRSGFGKDILDREVYRLKVDAEGTLSKESVVTLPEKVNLFDFTFADVEGDGSPEIVMIDQDDRLVVLSDSGKRLWKSEESYGGTTRYLGGADISEPGALEERLQTGEQRYYVPGRIAVRDINRDGKADIIVTKNISSTMSRFFASVRSYPSGEVHALTWDGIGLTELWHTRKIDGYIADLQLVPEALRQAVAEQPGNAQLFVGVVLKSGGVNILSSAESTVLQYPISSGEESTATAGR